MSNTSVGSKESNMRVTDYFVRTMYIHINPVRNQSFEIKTKIEILRYVHACG